MKNVIKRLTVFLITIMFLESLPISVLAETLNDAIMNYKPSIPQQVSKYSKIVGEIEEKRDANTKYFMKEDNTYEAAVYPEPVHYLDNGVWKDIDNSLVDVNEQGEESLGNKSSGVKFNLSKYSDANKLVSVSQDKYKISWSLEGAAKSEAKKSILNDTELNTIIEKQADDIITNDASVKEKTDAEKKTIKEAVIANEKKKALTKTQSSVTYSEVFKNVNLEYILKGNNLKENIVLNEKGDKTIFSFKINVENVIAKLEKNIVKLYDKGDTSKEVFALQAPYMVDKNGALSDDIKVSLKEDLKGYTLTLTPNVEWLNASDRVYPVKIDPPVTTSQEVKLIEDNFVSSATWNQTKNYYLDPIIEIGNGSSAGITRGLIKFTLPTQITSADIVISATLGLVYNPYETYDHSNTQINVHKVLGNWSSPTLNWTNQPTFNNRIEDFENVGGEDVKYNYWDITSIAKEWYTTGVNNGLMLRSNNDSGSYKVFVSSDNLDFTTIRPIVGFEFINNSGLGGNWTYHSQDVGRAGTGYVNDYNGNLVFAHNDITMSGNRMPVSITHVYNSNERAKNDFGLGQGFRLNLNQKVYASNIPGKSYYTYEDEDGTKHYFDATNTSSMKSETLADVELSKNTDGTFTLKDKKDNKLLFNSSGPLVSITDKNGNSQRIFFTNGKVTSVIDGAYRTTTLNYNAQGLLSEIIAPDSSKTTYAYTGTRLTSITYPDTKTSYYAYDSDNKLLAVANYTGYRIDYNYYGIKPYRVSKIIQGNNTSILGNEINVKYGYNSTTFTDVTGKSSVYQFDNTGKTVSIKDPNGNAKYYKYESATNTTKLTSESKLQKTINNLALNPGVESDRNWTGTGAIGTETANYVTEQKHLGNRSIKITKDSTSTKRYMQQEVTVEKGKTYTFSAYVKTTGVSAGSNVGATLVAYSQTNSGAYQGKWASYLNGTNDWTRLSVTFTVPADSASDKVLIRPSLDLATGIAYYDDFQLEEGSLANRYNLIENGDLKGNNQVADYWSNNSLEAGDGNVSTTDSNHPRYLDSKVLKVNGNPSKFKGIAQAINVSGNAGDTYDLSAWAKGASVHDGTFAVQAAFITSGEPQWENLNFNRDTDDWQYVNGVIKAKTAYSRIDIYVSYINNVNEAYFDGIQLYKEEFGNSYVYDVKGNLTSVEDLAKKKSTFEYNTSNDLVKSINPNGSEYKYEYDENHNVTKATTAQNVVYNFKYDSYGNPVVATIGNDKNYIGSTANYTANGNYLSYITDSFGNKTSYSYNETNGILNNVTDANGKVTKFGYDSMNRQTSVEKVVDGQTLSNAYNKVVDNQTIKNEYTYENDRIKQVKHNEFSYNFDYDLLGNNTKVSVGNVPLITNNYEARTGKLLDYTYGNGQKIANIYDGSNRITGTAYNEDNNHSISYTGNIQNKGLVTVSGNDALLGTIGLAKRLESLNITLEGVPNGMKIKYQAHVQDTGWQDWVYGGTTPESTAGTIDESKRMEAVRIKLEGAPAGYSVQYQVHVGDIGWMDPVENGELAGTIGEGRQIEAIRINVSKLTNIYKFDANGNLGFKQDITNNTSFKYSYDISNRLTKVEEGSGDFTSYSYDNNNNANKITDNIKDKDYITNFVFDKDNRASTITYNRGYVNTVNYTYDPLFGRLANKNINTGLKELKTTYDYEKGNGTSVGVQYSGFVSSAWQNQVSNGNIAGTVGQSLPLQDLKISLTTPIAGMRIKYQVHASDVAWNGWVYDGAPAGEAGKDIEAVQISLEGAPAGYHVQYQVQTEANGWMAPVADGAIAGTTGQGLRLEAIKISIISDNVQYSGYVPSAWQGNVKDGSVAGTVGQDKPLQGLNISLVNPPSNMKIAYQVHVTNIGWMDWVEGGTPAGQIGSDIEAVRITLVGAPSGYHVQYQVHVQNQGWTEAETDGNTAGTTGLNLNIEAIKITIVKPGTDTTRIASVNNNGNSINYTYDNNGNIETITEDGKVIRYYYNELNELVREDNPTLTVQGKTITYEYDAGGNITSKKEYSLTEGALGTPSVTIPYLYGDANWKDKLTSYNGKPITYDQIGNPLKYDEKNFTWEKGRQLSGISATGLTASYKYNDSGIRTEKTVTTGTTTKVTVNTKYHLVGDKVTYESNGTDNIYYTYDSTGQLLSMNITTKNADGSWTTPVEYYYKRNVKGDIIGLYDRYGAVVVKYTYDSWGKLISTTGSLASTVGDKNPYRYRGYRYDTESGLYYLQSRYYNPDWGRFINADAIGGQVGTLLSHNVFAYCFNNPINMSDDSGHWPTWSDVTSWANDALDWVINETEELLSNISPIYNLIEACMGETIITGQTLTDEEREDKADKFEDMVANAAVMGSVRGKPTPTKHALYRKTVTGRVAGPVMNDIQRAKLKDILIEDNGNYIVRGNNGRLHVLSPDGQRHITSLNRTSSNVEKLIMQGRYRYSNQGEYDALIELFK
ncbi:MAG: DNRLRE domain-containing protein [Clostridiaceae bacterium]